MGGAMEPNTTDSQVSRLKADGFFTVAFWQLMSFVMLILLVWVNEILDLSALWFEINPGNPGFYRGCVLTIGVIIIAIITIGHTYIQQKRIIKGLLVVCSSCRKIRVDEDVWEHMDKYVHEHSLALISHGLCPHCFDQAKRELDDYDKSVRKPAGG